jgi:hypothetical protein
MQQFGEGAALNSQERLFLSLTEQMSRPLLQVAQLADLAAVDP